MSFDFDQSRALGFRESPAMERNLVGRAPVTAGAGPGVVHQGVFQRVDHSFLINNPNMHSYGPLSDVHVVDGSGSANGAIDVFGSGWARLFVRVKGVAAAIPPQNYEIVEGQQHTQRIGLVIAMGSTNEMRVANQPTYTEFVMPDNPFGPIRTGPVALGRNVVYSNKTGLILNLVLDADGWSEEPRLFDRLVSVSCRLPTTIFPYPAFGGWTVGGNLYEGGEGAGNVPYTIRFQRGRFISGAACKNTTLNYRSIVYPHRLMLGNPASTVQLQIALAGFRPTTDPADETYQDFS